MNEMRVPATDSANQPISDPFSSHPETLTSEDAEDHYSPPEATTPFPANPYEAPGQGQVRQADVIPHRADQIMIFGIAGLGTSVFGCGCCGLFSLIGLGFCVVVMFMAPADLRAMAEGRMDPSGQSNTQVGRVCAIIGLAISTLGLLFNIGMLAIQFLDIADKL